jgi:tetratricopeptide (TPR) repeat protein
MRGLLFVGWLGALSALTGAPGFAQTQAGAVQVDARAEVAAALYAASATQAAAERSADAHMRAQAAEIGRLRREGRASRLQIAELEERYVADLAQRDRAYAQEIVVFRTAVEDIAATPEGAAALARFNAGDEIGALAVLDQLRAARARARQVRANIESAAEGRRIAALALEARNRGRLGTQAVIARYEEVTRLDPNMQWDWVELARAYQAVGSLAAAERSAQRALLLAASDRERGVAMSDLVQIQVAQGNLSAALRIAEDYNTLTSRLAAAEPSSPQLRHDLAISHDRLGGVLFAQRDYEAARAHFEVSMAISQQIAMENPHSNEAQRGVSSSLAQLSALSFTEGSIDRARALAEESLEITQRLATAHPSLTGLQRDVVARLFALGMVQEQQGNLVEARDRYETGIAIAQRLVVIDPTNAQASMLVAMGLSSLAGVSLRLGDLVSALALYEESLEINEALSASDPSNAATQHSMASNLVIIGNLLVTRNDLLGANARYMRALAIRERLAAADPDATSPQFNVFLAHGALSVVSSMLGDWDSAVSHMERSVEIARELVARQPSDPTFQDALHRSEDRLRQLRAGRAR